MSNTEELAEKNLRALQQNPYPGRGLVIGRNGSGEMVFVYWIMGRSPESRNRVFLAEGKRLYTDYADSSKKSDDPNIIYNAMDENPSICVVSNGHQTDALIAGFEKSIRLKDILACWDHEGAKASYTPRISGMTSKLGKNPQVRISLIRKTLTGEESDRFLFEYHDIPRGFGYCITTYTGDGNPLPTFNGVPYLVPIIGTQQQIAESFWSALNESNRVALAVNVINSDAPILIINKYNQV